MFNIKNRLVDLLPIFKKYVRTQKTSASASLKVVLPTLLLHLSYQDLAIQHGMATMSVYRNLHNNSTKEAFKEERKDIFAYCKLDTEVVLDLYKLLYQGYERNHTIC